MEMNIEYKFIKRNGKIKMCISANDCPIEISHHILEAIAASEGVLLCDIYEIELDGGKYAESCFVGRRWNPDLRMRGVPKEGKGFETAFASLRKLKLKNIESIGKDFASFHLDSKPLEFVADKNLKNIEPSAFEFSRLSSFYAPAIKDEKMLEDALAPHGEIRPLSESMPGEPTK